MTLFPLPPAVCPACGRPVDDPTENRPGLARADGNDTMRDAAKRVEPRSGSQRARVLELAMIRGELGVTDDEIEQVLDLAHQTASARRNELVADGYLTDSGIRRKTRRYADAAVWVATPLAHAWWKARG
jgi:hypothetical protein